MNSLRVKSKEMTFKSYVNFGSPPTDHNMPRNPDPELACSDSDSQGGLEICESPGVELNPSLLPGELVVAQADHVLKFNTFSNRKTGISGALFCTNFKLSFVTTEQLQTNICQRHLILGEDDICLINIQSVFLVSGGRKRKLLPGAQVPLGRIEVIEVHCKNFRVYTFSFKFSPKGHDKILLDAIVHYAFASRITMLFIFDFSATNRFEEDLWSEAFSFPSDWLAEIKRCGCPGWRTSQCNEQFQICDSLPESFVVPASLLDTHLQRAAPNFTGHRVLTWSWGTSSGSALVRMAKLDPVISNHEVEDSFVDAVRKSHRMRHPVKVMDLESCCPSLKDIQMSFQKLQELCMPTDPQEFWEKDSHYFSSLENTRWLQNVSACLSTSSTVATYLMEDDVSVIITESDARDLCCVISSLAQILLDPYFRTQEGFQRLIQKEWVALGHPFTERFQQIKTGDGEQCPVFLLFLDCVWQLQYQHPTRFEFSETYLTTVWDTTHISLFDTFLFSSQKQRIEAHRCSAGPAATFSAWNWRMQFSQRDINYFTNPLYHLNVRLSQTNPELGASVHCRPRSADSRATGKMSSSHVRPLTVVESCMNKPKRCSVLHVGSGISSLRVWRQCYERWMPLAQVVGGGLALVHLNNFMLAEDIRALELKLKKLKACLAGCPASQLRHRRIASDDYLFTAEIDTCTAVQQNCQVVTSVFPFSPPGPLNWGSFHAVPSASYLYIAQFGSEEQLDD